MYLACALAISLVLRSTTSRPVQTTDHQCKDSPVSSEPAATMRA